MNYFGLTAHLKDAPQAVAAYKEYHKNLWPEVAASLHRVGLKRSRIFLHGRQLFMYMEVADDFDASTYLARYLEEPKAVEWERLMSSYLETPPNAAPGQLWTRMEPIFELN